MTPITWADGFGIWHVRVSSTCVSPLIAARGALRDAITSREPNADRRVWMHPERVPSRDEGKTMVYREGQPSH